MSAALLTSVSPTPGILRGHSWRCPHRILDGSKSPDKLRATNWSTHYTNSAFRGMKHAVTTALTWDQVLEFILEPYRTLPLICRPRNPCKSEVFCGSYVNLVRSRMARFQARDPLYTMQYMWSRARSGIFVSIRNSRLELFVPFCNTNYMNSWTSDAREVLPKNDLAPTHWWSNGWMLCEKCPSNFVGDTWVTTIGNMLMEACKNGMYDIDFVINKRDTPCARLDGCDPMNPMDINLPRTVDVSQLLPIFSFFSGPEYADVTMPHPVDWQRLTGRYFAQACEQKPVQTRPDVYWEHKAKQAVFRGSMTGIGSCAKSNQRAYLCSLPIQNLDAELTGTNSRFKVDPRSRAITKAHRAVATAQFMDFNEQQEEYRYGVCIDGHSAVDRMGRLFNGRQAILKIASPCFALAPNAWLSDFCFAWEHYVPVENSLCNVEASIRWLIDNDKHAQRLAARCAEMNQRYVSVSAITDWWRLVSSC